MAYAKKVACTEKEVDLMPEGPAKALASVVKAPKTIASGVAKCKQLIASAVGSGNG